MLARFPANLPIADRQRRLASAFLVAVFTYIFLANAWLGDDAYITFRVVWNLLHGYGPVFNTTERVQAYTHPLWMLVLAGAHAITREFFFTALAVCYAFSLAALIVVGRFAGTVVGAAVATGWLLTSKAFVDYTSSGLENPLSYLLLALFYSRVFRMPADAPVTTRDARMLGLLAGLAFVNRIDSVLLFLPALMWFAWRGLRSQRAVTGQLALAFSVPVVLWLAFATVYYGFPLPNTYYAKVATGIPRSILYRQGFAYLLNSFTHDPITLGTIAVAAVMALSASAAARCAALATLFYVAYTISVGGDFMSGRFFAIPFLVAVLTIVEIARGIRLEGFAAAALVVYNVMMPIVPLKTTAGYDAAWPWRSQNGIKDERGHYHQITNVFFYSPFRELPDHTWVREGRSFSQGPEKVTVQGSIGFYGLMAGPDKHLVDRNALSDPLLARLPVSPHLYFEFFAGHYFRDIPDGYVETLTYGENRIADPSLHAYYDQLALVLRGPLFSAERFRAMWHLHTGEGRKLLARHHQSRPISLSIRASNDRFGTDAGDVDREAGLIRSNGRDGYLQSGPGIPMRAGSYHARWIGTIQPAPEDSFGFVDVWADGQRIARQEARATDLRAEERVLTEIPFVLPNGVTDLEYRLWVRGRPGITLERVELHSRGR